MTIGVPYGATATGAALAAAARILAAGGRAAVADALALTRTSGRCRSVVLRSADGHLVARADAPALVPAQAPPVDLPGHRGPLRIVADEAAGAQPAVLDVPVRAGGELVAILTAVADEPFRPDQGDLLTGVGDLLALALGPTEHRHEPGRSILDAEADRAVVAAALRETIGRALVTLRYAADRVAAGDADPDALDEPVRAATAAVRAARGEARAYSLDAGLRVALHELAGSADDADDGRPLLLVDVTAADPALDLLPPAVAVVVERVAAAALRGATGRAAVRATYHDGRVKLWVESAEIAYDASELDRWARRASALGGVLRLRLDGVDLELPGSPV